MAAWINMSLGMELGLHPGDFLLDGDPVPPPKRGQSPPPQFPAHFYCGQTAGCIKIQDATDIAIFVLKRDVKLQLTKMPLGADVGLSPGDFVLDGDPVPAPKKGAEPPKVRGGIEPWWMARWKARAEFLLSIIELLFLSLTVEELQGKTCQNSQPSGVGRSL